MKKILLTASTTALLCGCGGPNYSITGNAGLEPGDSVFLIGSGRTELAAGVVCADSTIRLQGRVAEPEIARLANQERIPVGTAVIFLEPGDIRTVPTDDRRVYAVSGTPLNDKKREFDERMADFDRKFRELPPDAPADSLYAAYTKLVPESIGANSDNLFGAYLFSVYEFDGNDIAAAKARLECFTPAMQAHPTLKRIAEKVAAAENTEIGKPYMDLTLPDAAGEPTTRGSSATAAGSCSTSGRRGAAPAAGKSRICARHTPPAKARDWKFTAFRSTTTPPNGKRSWRTTTCHGSMCWA